MMLQVNFVPYFSACGPHTDKNQYQTPKPIKSLESRPDTESSLTRPLRNQLNRPD
uniref:Uncharacterized protein n=1 Tax=Anguilla anguilla TaxID=7936 RepID=A0A0E9VKS1_ANGAN